MWSGSYAQIWRLGLEQDGSRVVPAGFLEEADLGSYLALLDDPGFTWIGPTIVSAWARRPGLI
jgi:hypothetical protein